jgi:hypothetical protein
MQVSSQSVIVGALDSTFVAGHTTAGRFTSLPGADGDSGKFPRITQDLRGESVILFNSQGVRRGRSAISNRRGRLQ